MWHTSPRQQRHRRHGVISVGPEKNFSATAKRELEGVYCSLDFSFQDSLWLLNDQSLNEGLELAAFENSIYIWCSNAENVPGYLVSLLDSVPPTQWQSSQRSCNRFWPEVQTDVMVDHGCRARASSLGLFSKSGRMVLIMTLHLTACPSCQPNLLLIMAVFVQTGSGAHLLPLIYNWLVYAQYTFIINDIIVFLQRGTQLAPYPQSL